MTYKTNIRQFIAALLLLVFAFGATPKKFLHDAVTMHQHTYKDECVSHKHTNIAATGFNCQIDNLVVEMPFVASVAFSIDFLPISHSIFQQHFCNNIIATNVCIAYLRGPPAC